MHWNNFLMGSLVHNSKTRSSGSSRKKSLSASSGFFCLLLFLSSVSSISSFFFISSLNWFRQFSKKYKQIKNCSGSDLKTLESFPRWVSEFTKFRAWFASSVKNESTRSNYQYLIAMKMKHDMPAAGNSYSQVD